MSDPAAHTFLFADLSGFTALTEGHGDEEAAELAAGFFEDARALLGEHAAKPSRRAPLSRRISSHARLQSRRRWR